MKHDRKTGEIYWMSDVYREADLAKKNCLQWD